MWFKKNKHMDEHLEGLTESNYTCPICREKLYFKQEPVMEYDGWVVFHCKIKEHSFYKYHCYADVLLFRKCPSNHLLNAFEEAYKLENNKWVAYKEKNL